MLERRHELYLEAGRARVSPERFGGIVDKRAQVAETEDGHAGNQAAGFVAKAVGHPLWRQGDRQREAPALQITVSREALASLDRVLSVAAGRRSVATQPREDSRPPSGDVIDIQTIDKT
jgi:hypothetical protein